VWCKLLHYSEIVQGGVCVCALMSLRLVVSLSSPQNKVRPRNARSCGVFVAFFCCSSSLSFWLVVGAQKVIKTAAFFGRGRPSQARLGTSCNLKQDLLKWNQLVTALVTTGPCTDGMHAWCSIILIASLLTPFSHS